MKHIFQFLGTGAGNANFGLPAAEGRNDKDVRRFISNFLSPDILIDFNHQTLEAMKTFGVDPKSIHHLLISHGHFDHFQPVEIINYAASLSHELAVFGNGMVCDALEFCRHNRWDSDIKRWVERKQRMGGLLKYYYRKASCIGPG